MKVAREGLGLEFWRREWDSNPRYRSRDMAVFKTAAFNHSAISPGILYKYRLKYFFIQALNAQFSLYIARKK